MENPSILSTGGRGKVKQKQWMPITHPFVESGDKANSFVLHFFLIMFT
jgi:hypothetical protein